MKDNFKKITKYVISAIIVVVSIYFATKGVDFEKLWITMRNANYIWVVIPVPIMIISHIIRAIRWKTILSPVHKADSIYNLFSAVMVGYLFNNITPRGGEFVRPYVYSKREKISYSSVFATIVVERFLDMLSLLILFAIAFIILRDKIVSVLPQDIDPTKLIYMSVLILIVAISSFYPPFVEFMLRKLIKPFSNRFYDRLIDIFTKFRKGFAIIKNPAAYMRITFETFLIWFCYSLPMYFMFFAFDFNSQIDFGIWDAMILIIISGIGFTILPSPGAIGMYHWLISGAMVTLYGINKEDALAYATITHAANFIVQVGIGLVFLIRERVSGIPTNDDLHIESTEKAT